MSKPSLETRLNEIRSLPSNELRQCYREVFGRPPAPRLGRDLLLRALAHQIQVERHGGLSRATKKALGQGASPPRKSRSRTLTPGTQLIREWQGETHTVDVLDGGFRWRGERFQSLSVIARTITGTRWSGPRFFGLTGGSSP